MGLAPQSGCISNFCHPTFLVIEPASEPCFHVDPPRRRTLSVPGTQRGHLSNLRQLIGLNCFVIESVEPVFFGGRSRYGIRSRQPQNRGWRLGTQPLNLDASGTDRLLQLARIRRDIPTALDKVAAQREFRKRRQIEGSVSDDARGGKDVGLAATIGLGVRDRDSGRQGFVIRPA